MVSGHSIAQQVLFGQPEFSPIFSSYFIMPVAKVLIFIATIVTVMYFKYSHGTTTLNILVLVHDVTFVNTVKAVEHFVNRENYISPYQLNVIDFVIDKVSLFCCCLLD